MDGPPQSCPAEDDVTVTIKGSILRFTNRALQDFENTFDARGSFIEPHAGSEVAIGTLEVRDYLRRRGAEHRSAAITGLLEDWRYPTHGPENRYKAILFIEKEGFDPLLRAAQIAARFDVALMSTKGMSTTAARIAGQAEPAHRPDPGAARLRRQRLYDPRHPGQR